MRFPECAKKVGLRAVVAFLLLAVAWAISCTSGRTGIDLIVAMDAALGIEQLRFNVALEGDDDATREGQWPEEPQLLESGSRVLLLVPDGWTGSRAHVNVEGLVGSDIAARGDGTVMIEKGATVELLVGLAERCPGACPLDTRECAGDGYRVCVTDSDGCTRMTAPTPCPDGESCSNGVCSEICEDECREGQKRCAVATDTSSTSRQICRTDHDSDPCYDWGPAIGCASSDFCLGGECLLSCDGEPCPCEAGFSQPCPDVAQCTGGERKCVNGVITECVFASGKSPEICNGLDDDCDGTIDNHLSPEFCDKKEGVCTGALRRCAGVAGWLTCTNTDYSNFAASLGLTYIPDNDPCDGQDNNCINGVDELATCGADESCIDGACSCDFEDCDGTCCSDLEVCCSASASCGGSALGCCVLPADCI